jgi:non-ribosomal peptide synthetase component F
MPGSTRAAAETLARARRTTPFAVTTAAAAILLAQLTGQRDLLMQVPYANRDQQVFESTLTCTVMNLVLRLRLEQASTFAELVDQTSQAARAAIDNLLPLGRILTNLREHGVPDVPERILVIVLHQNSIELAIDMPGLHVKTEDLPADAARAELTFGVAPRPDPGDGYRVFAEHPLDRWDAETVDSWMHTYADIVARACAAPDTPLEQL